MKSRCIPFLLLALAFLLQSTVFQFLSFAGIAPNLLLIVVSSFALMRGEREGMWLGLFAGFLLDIFYGQYLGIYCLLYLWLGFLCGVFQKRFYPDDFTLPMMIIGGSDFVCNLIIYLTMFLTRGRTSFLYYLRAVILPELVYTILVGLFLYLILLKINSSIYTRSTEGAVES